MPSREDVLRWVMCGIAEWDCYLDSLTRADLARVHEVVVKLLDEFEELIDQLHVAQARLDLRLKKREEKVERSRRQKRGAQAKTSLREFMNHPFLDTDMLLEKLTLCTDTGAEVLLEGLSFEVVGEQREVRSVNEAKDLFQRGHEPWAGWRLYYIRDGRRSAGFGWERPFLDEVFVLSGSGARART